MSRNVIETVMGGVVLVIAAGFLATAYKGRAMNGMEDGIRVIGIFNNASGVANGSDVRIGGVKVGVVDGMKLNPKTYQAEVGMLLSTQTPVPDDSSAAIVSDGLLGSKFVALEPGASDTMLKSGDTITYTQSSVSLEQLIGKFIFGAADDGEEAPEEEPAPEEPESKDHPDKEQESEKKHDGVPSL